MNKIMSLPPHKMGDVTIQLLKNGDVVHVVIDPYEPTEHVFALDSASFERLIERMQNVARQESHHDLMHFARLDEELPEEETE